MKLSIIVVNYNVKYFLQQLLQSIERSRVDFDFETIVVDNCSSDGSEKLIPHQYPAVQYIYNQTNLGFAKANNLGIRLAKGTYILLLNPDTILDEDTLQKTINYISSDDQIGALGVRMIDGSGRYLPESKRGLPTPSVAFYKAFGINTLWPKSATLNKYYLGHLSEDQIHEIDILTGAFFLVPKRVLDQVGLLDEHFFMYGEDIDLSYRIQRAGFKIIYFPKTSIIHFKGESTRKDSIAYIRSFYGAMILFADKHFSGSSAKLLQIVLKSAIYLKAGWSFMRGILAKWALPLFEAACIYFVLSASTSVWAQFYYRDPSYYAQSLLQTNLLIYVLSWMLSLFLAGSYDEPYRGKPLFKGWLAGWVLIAILYAFFDPNLRPSRAMVLMAGPIVLLTEFCIRFIWHRIVKGNWMSLRSHPSRFAIVAKEREVSQIRDLMDASQTNRNYIGQISPSHDQEKGELGSLIDLDQLVHFHRLDEIVFASKDVDSGVIMKWMTELGPQILYKIAPDRASAIVGSHSKNKPGEWFTFDIQYQVAHPSSQRSKRLLDVIVAIFFLPVSLPLALRYGGWYQFVRKCVTVLMNRKTWVSYQGHNADRTLPHLKEGFILPSGQQVQDRDDEILRNINFYYAKDYTIWKDVSLIWQNLPHLF